ncbi:chemotaxis protein CheA [Paenibacillus whitsoniae]|uniref:Chemotaxis protein CheA n=1 Tax=Paenibacillus whitsoniae TaxID=2496558 RepID=A0A3S0CF86_9BACL|nr:chemotaxis protein CheA [Paenibacillus whitsoniae]RTE11386.1 chemotaxis protein CheA [Paenibacillus whitsoniae]
MLDLSDFREVFLEELEEQLQMMEQEILSLEIDGGSDAGIQRMFRAAHTLKGSSAAMGFDKMKTLTHEMEHFLDKIRNRSASVSSALINLFFACLDRMKNLQAEIVEHHREQSDITDLVAKLQAMHMESESKRRGKPQIPVEVFNSAQMAEGKECIFLRVRLSDESVMKLARFNVINTKLSNLGTVYWKDADLESEVDDDKIQDAQWLLSSQLEQDEIKRIVESMMDVQCVEIEKLQFEHLEVDATEITEGTQHTTYEGKESPEPAALEHVEKYKSSTIRVNVDRLEQLMNFVGELVIEQTRIQQVEKQFRQKFGGEHSVEELGDISYHLARIVGELQENVMKVRMLPIDQLFSRFSRMIRDLSQSLHKEVELVLEGRETELDRTLIEEIGDPLIHLIRNAIDHGIETPEVRRTSGKPEKGTIRIQAAHEDNQIAITVSDDGTGIDPNKIRHAAIKKGVISEEKANQLSDHDAIQLIFHPGFSTASQLSEVSGRGVGMDIVRTDVERLNGLIDIETELGKGTIFKIRLPLTLAIITGLLVDIGRKTFILPMSNVTEIVRVEPSSLQKVKGIPVITIRNQIIPVIWLHDYFGYARSNETSKFVPIVIIGRAEKRLAIAVDELLGNQEIVIKSLGAYVGHLDGISGATILGDGKVALILEVGGIMKLVNDHITTK